MVSSVQGTFKIRRKNLTAAENLRPRIMRSKKHISCLFMSECCSSSQNPSLSLSLITLTMHVQDFLIITRSSKDECSTGSNNHLRSTDLFRSCVIEFKRCYSSSFCLHIFLPFLSLCLFVLVNL